MSEQNRYTAQEMRNAADAMSNGCDSELVVVDADECGLHINRNKTFEVASMLRQAVDTEEDNARLKARLEAVVKECERIMNVRIEQSDNINMQQARYNVAYAILCAARGEGGAE